MRRKRLLWQLFASYLLIALAPLAISGGYAIHAFRQFHLAEIQSQLEARARLFEQLLAGRWSVEESPAIDALTVEAMKRTGTRVTVLLPTGRVLGDSERDPGAMDNHLNRPEIETALQGRTGVSIRYSNTLKRTMMYVAIPVLKENRSAGVIRTSVPLSALEDTVSRVRRELLLGGALLLALASAAGLIASRRVSRTLEELKRGAERFGQGQLEKPLPIPDSEELGGLARALNDMANQLSKRLQTVVQQRSELEAVLFSMVEGVLAVDTAQRIVNFNQAAAWLLGFDAGAARGRYLQESVRNIELQEIAAGVLQDGLPLEREILIRGEVEEKYLQVHGTLLQDSKGKAAGALLVFNDMTRLRRLENVRRDFVANVSHELKTPITSIKASVETLLDGALADPANARRFLSIVLRQADQLNHIIEDLLSLSRLERESEKSEIPIEDASLAEILHNAVQACDVPAQEKGMEIRLHCDPSLRTRVNPPLLQQAVVNLIDNAIKYSEPRTRIDVQAVEEEDRFTLSVRDQGYGIEPKHLPRVFERFYRVDKGRSRKQGGTGLGLAIVKHIAQAHGGQTSVESNPGHGSVFSIHLPKPEKRPKPPEPGSGWEEPLLTTPEALSPPPSEGEG